MAQIDRIIPGPPPDEYVDVTGDGRADLLITSRTVHISDPQQPGFLGLYKLGVRTLSGNAVLMWSTPSNQRWYTLDDSVRLDTAELAARIHFKQLSWTDQDLPTEFWLLERPFGPAITKDQDGWYGTGDHHDGHTMVLRSANEHGTSISAFAFELPFPYGRIQIKVKGAVHVPNGYGEEGDPIPTKPKLVDEYDFGQEPAEPQVIIPPGLPPDEEIEIVGDEAPDVVITAREELSSGTARMGYFVRGVSPLPGVSFLMKHKGDGLWEFFRLPYEAQLRPEQLSAGLANGTLRWASPEGETVFCRVLKHPFGMDDKPQEWSYAELDEEEVAVHGALVYRTSYYGREMVIGVLEVTGIVPGGEVYVNGQFYVEEGKVLEVR